MENPRRYGKKPFRVAVVHGGPGAAGEMAPVARELSSVLGILEPLQTADTLESQIKELKNILQEHGEVPALLIGWSWGAWLCYLLAAQFPNLVHKLILVGSGPFEDKYVPEIMQERLSRLGIEGAAQAQYLMETLNDPSFLDKDASLTQLGELISKADAYDPIPEIKEDLIIRYDTYRAVSSRANELRRNGELLKIGKQIQCPVLAIHGDSDPHPADGVQAPLSKVLKNFRFILLEKCGHKPWVENHARDPFYKIIKEEIQ